MLVKHGADPHKTEPPLFNSLAPVFVAAENGSFLAMKWLVEEHGVQLRRLPDDVLAKLKDISQEVVAEAALENELAGRIHDSYTTFQQDVSKYHAYSEQAYLNAR